MKELEDQFRQFDRDGDGAITLGKLKMNIVYILLPSVDHFISKLLLIPAQFVPQFSNFDNLVT